MNVAVHVEQQNGVYAASVLGAPDVRATAGSRDAAVAALRAVLEARVSAGELVLVDVAPKGVLGLAGRYHDEPGWQEMWERIKLDAYRERDEEKAREFPE